MNWENERDVNVYDTYDEYEEDRLYNDDSDDDFDEITLEKENDLLRQLDPDLVEYFNEARIIKRKTNFKEKKNKKEKVNYNIGEIVLINNKKHSIIYGPYEVDKKFFYEVESFEGNILSIEEKYIQKTQ